MEVAKLKNATPLKVLGRSHYACSRCKNSKIKCSGDKPACSNCVNSKKGNECVYPNKDRKVIILESQLNNLQNTIDNLQALLQKQQTDSIPRSSSSSNKKQKLDGSLSPKTSQSERNMTEYDFSDPPQSATLLGSGLDAGNSKVVNLDQYGATTCQVFDTELQSFLHDVSKDQKKAPFTSYENSVSSGEEVDNGYTYDDYLLDQSDYDTFDRRILSATKYQLPLKDYAVFLLRKVTKQYASEFYLIDKESFFEMVDNIYESNSKVNTLSLSFFFAVLASGEQLCASNSDKPQNIPGVEFFLLATQLFKFNQEELSLDYIQCALIIGLYAVNLNRSATAYCYFGIAIRAAVSKGLHRQECNFKQYLPKLIAEDEKQYKEFKEKAKRVWWTAFSIDTFWSTKMSLPVHIQICDTDIDYPLENYMDLNDDFDSSILHEHVNLTKFISKIIKKLYCPQNRTYYFTRATGSIDSIKSSVALFLKNTLECLADLTEHFEQKLPPEYIDKRNIIQKNNRRLADIYLRYNQLLLLVTRPLILSIFKKKIEENDYTRKATNAGIFAACCNIDIIYNLKKNGLLFGNGFWDSQYVFSALLVLIIGSLTGRKYSQLLRGIKLMKFMVSKGNINARNNFKRLKELDSTLVHMSGSKFSLKLNDDEFDKTSESQPKVSKQDNYQPPISKTVINENTNGSSNVGRGRKRSILSDESISPTTTDTSVKLEETLNNLDDFQRRHSFKYDSQFQIHDDYSSNGTTLMVSPSLQEIRKSQGLINQLPLSQIPHEISANTTESKQGELHYNQIPTSTFDNGRNSIMSLQAWNEIHNYQDIHFTPQENLNFTSQSLNNLIGNIQTWDYLGVPQINECGIGSFPVFNETELNYGNPAY